jgi:two-component system, NtrC family, sensor kinase
MKDIFKHVSIRYKIILLTLAVVTFVISAALVMILQREYRIMNEDIRQEARTYVDILSHSSAEVMANQDLLQANSYLAVLQAFPLVENAAYIQYQTNTKSFQKIAQFDKNHTDNIEFRFPDKHLFNLPEATYNLIEDGSSLYCYRPIITDGQRTGVLAVRCSKSQMDKKIAELIWMMSWLFALLLLVSFAISTFVQRLITKPLMDLSAVANRISKEGDYSVRVSYESRDEMGKLYTSFNKMLSQINAQNQKIQEMNQSLDLKIQERVVELTTAKEESEKITLEAIAAKEKSEQLALELENKHKFDAALARFAEIMQSKSTENIEKWGDHVLLHLVRHLKALQAVLYSSEELGTNEIRLRLTSTYALDVKTILKKVMKAGDGLPGEAVKLREPIVIDNLPDGYLKVVSALGETDAKHLVIIPLIAEDAVQGVLELSSFEPFTEENINFLKDVSKSVAYSLLVVKNKDNIQRLLNETRMKNVMLTSQEEELKLKIAELETTQQEMQQVELSLRDSQDSLRSLNENLEKRVSERTQELQNTLTDLKSAQAQLVQSEKMASLGQLISGIAHEINTPIGAVKASASNMMDVLPPIVSYFPDFLLSLSDAERNTLQRLLNSSLVGIDYLNSREQRAKRKELKEYLEGYQVPNAEGIARKLIDIGIAQIEDQDLNLLKMERVDMALDFIYKFAQLNINIKNIQVASEKTNKIVFALKSHAHRQSDDKPVAIDLSQSLEVILTLYHNQIKHGIELSTHLEHVPTVWGYPDELGQVWTNIIHNALQAMEYKGHLEVNLRAEDDFAYVEIIDGGPGIPPEIQARIFEPFFTTKAQGEGTGLGLDICSKIIKKHYGTIQVQSEPGRTCFLIKLPLQNSFPETEPVLEAMNS